MVKIKEMSGLNYFIPTNEIGGGGRTEPPHIHVCKGSKQSRGSTAFWLDPIKLKRDNGDFSSYELREIERQVKENRDLFLKEYKRIHG